MTPERRTELQKTYIDSVISEMTNDDRLEFVSDVMNGTLGVIPDSIFIAGIIKSGHSSLLTKGEIK